MTSKVLLTGRPGCGKTTLIKRVVNNLALPAGGFYTEEIRERGERVGFKIITLDDETAVLAHDEIGPMEIRSSIFRDAVNEALDREVAVLATIFARSLPFTDAIKTRPDVTLIEVRPDNRERLVSELSHRFNP